ncbi:MAG: RagB/SusD family nutrient uptake outer membrane protein, partial [Cytophagaceae bacterium]
FRLAEIYLNYAEAKFELGDEATCRDYLSRVRARVGMPALPATVTGEALRQRVYNERRIELAMEGHRFFDVRRWKIAADVESRPIMGMDITRNLTTGATTYTPVQLAARKFEERMYLLPIESTEIRRNSNLTQSPGW